MNIWVPLYWFRIFNFFQYLTWYFFFVLGSGPVLRRRLYGTWLQGKVIFFLLCYSSCLHNWYRPTVCISKIDVLKLVRLLRQLRVWFVCKIVVFIMQKGYRCFEQIFVFIIQRGSSYFVQTVVFLMEWVSSYFLHIGAFTIVGWMSVYFT